MCLRREGGMGGGGVFSRLSYTTMVNDLLEKCK